MLFKIFKKKKYPPLYHDGNTHNLKEIYHSVNTRYFNQSLDLRITWFGQGKVPRTRILLGSYRPDRREIRVNRVLDQAHVPKSVVEFIVYHEMLHHVLPPKRGKKGRRQIHHQEFKEREKQFEDFLSAKAFLSRII